MSDMHEGYEDTFAAMVSDLQIGRTLPMNGVEVIVDAELGNEMRQKFLNIGEKAMSTFTVPTGQLTRKQVKHIDRIMYKLVEAGRAPAKLDELVAVSGAGVYLAYSEDSDGNDCNMELLTPDQTLFGYFQEVNYNSYPFVQDVECLPSDYEGDLDVEDADGLVMALGSVMLCEGDGYGQLQDLYAYAVVPLQIPSLVIHKTDIRWAHDAV